MHGGDVGSSVQSGCDLGQDFGAAVLFARGFAKPRRLQQAAQLSGQDGGLGGQVVVEELFFGIMQERYRADDFVKDHQGRGHQGASVELLRQGKAARLDGD